MGQDWYCCSRSAFDNEYYCFSLKERMIPLRVNDELILNGEFDRKEKLVFKIHKDLTFSLSENK